MKKVILFIVVILIANGLSAQDFKFKGIPVTPGITIEVLENELGNIPIELDNGGMMPDLKQPRITTLSNSTLIPVCERALTQACNCSGNIFTDNNASVCMDLDVGSDDEKDNGSLNASVLALGTYTIQLDATNATGVINSPEFTLNVTPTVVSIPALSQWGVFLFILLILNLGLVTIYNQQIVTATNEGMLVTPRFHIPFDWDSLKQVFPYTMGLVVLLFVLVMLIWGEIIPDDIIGLILAFPLLSYFLFIAKLLKK